MKILIASKNRIPVVAYGGTERVIWDLGRELVALGHEVAYLVKPGSRCDFGQVLNYDKRQPFLPQVLEAVRHSQAQVVHFQSNPFDSQEQSLDFPVPYLLTAHGNAEPGTWFPRNTIFISHDHARRHGAQAVVYNGLHWDSYGPVDWTLQRQHFHFLGNVGWPFKNFQGAVEVAMAAQVTLRVMGGKRLQIKRGFRFTPQRNVRFHGQTGGAEKFRLLNTSKGMVFPVTWHEPFGLAIVESMYFGCPVFATPYGAIQEIVTPECGWLGHSVQAMAEQLLGAERFNSQACHARARDVFNAQRMARGYAKHYTQVLDGSALNADFPSSHEFDQRLPWTA